VKPKNESERPWEKCATREAQRVNSYLAFQVD